METTKNYNYIRLPDLTLFFPRNQEELITQLKDSIYCSFCVPVYGYYVYFSTSTIDIKISVANGIRNPTTEVFSCNKRVVQNQDEYNYERESVRFIMNYLLEYFMLHTHDYFGNKVITTIFTSDAGVIARF